MLPVASEIERALAGWLAEGRLRIGQVAIGSHREGGYSLCHADDVGRSDLAADLGSVEVAREDDAMGFRPLKGAASLRHGWQLRAADISDLRIALEAIYPGRLGAFLRWSAGALAITPLHETLSRQTGMYRVTAKLTDDQAAAVKRTLCGGCLRQILWGDGAARGLASEVIPLLCQEACNLFVSEARAVIKGSRGSA